MSFTYIFLGFFVKIITGLDDTITHIPVLASLTRTRKGKIAFSIGTLLAIILAIIAAETFAKVINGFMYARYVSAGLVFILAGIIYFDIVIHKPREQTEKKFIKEEEDILKLHRVSTKRFFQLLGIGFVASAATVVDDVVAYSSLFLLPGAFLFAMSGILIGTIAEILIVIYFAEQISHFKYKTELASAGLLLLGILILFGII